MKFPLNFGAFQKKEAPEPAPRPDLSFEQVWGDAELHAAFRKYVLEKEFNSDAIRFLEVFEASNRLNKEMVSFIEVLIHAKSSSTTLNISSDLRKAILFEYRWMKLDGLSRNLGGRKLYGLLADVAGCVREQLRSDEFYRFQKTVEYNKILGNRARIPHVRTEGRKFFLTSSRPAARTASKPRSVSSHPS